MLLGIHIKLNENNLYSKPFSLNNNDNSNIFVAQIIRDVDFSFLCEKNETMILSIIVYNNVRDCYNANKENKDNHNFTKLGEYTIVFDEIVENFVTDTFEKGVLRKYLDIQYNLCIEFSVIYRASENNYILSTPSITGNKNYLKLNQ